MPRAAPRKKTTPKKQALERVRAVRGPLDDARHTRIAGTIRTGLGERVDGYSDKQLLTLVKKAVKVGFELGLWSEQALTRYALLHAFIGPKKATALSGTITRQEDPDAFVIAQVDAGFS